MQIVTTPTLEGMKITQYLGLVTGDAIFGANLFRDIIAGIRDLVGGRVDAYEQKMKTAKQAAIRDLIDRATERGANAVVGVSIDHEFINMRGVGGMMMVSCTGTAVIIAE